MHYGISVMIAVLHLGGFNAEFVALFTPLEYRYTGGEYQDELFRYRLFVPETRGPDERMPLIVWLHGRGEAGTDNIDHVRWLDHLVFTPPWDCRDYPFFLLAVQCPLDNQVWIRTDGAQADDMINVVRSILDKTLQEYPIDRERVYLAGISSGGLGCWDFATRFPQYFAAVAPMGSGGADTNSIGALVDIPVCVFHCTRDAKTPIDSVRKTVEALRAAGGNVHLTEVDAASHDCWNPAFDDYHLLDWLLSQRRGEPSPAPGSVPLATRLKDFASSWQWWQALLQLGIPAAVIAVVWKAARERRRRRQ